MHHILIHLTLPRYTYNTIRTFKIILYPANINKFTLLITICLDLVILLFLQSIAPTEKRKYCDKSKKWTIAWSYTYAPIPRLYLYRCLFFSDHQRGSLRNEHLIRASQVSNHLLRVPHAHNARVSSSARRICEPIISTGSRRRRLLLANTQLAHIPDSLRM